MAKMNFDCAVKLLRCDVLPVLNTKSVNSTISENTDVSKKSKQIKRSTRISKKNLLQNNLVIENDRQLNTKNKNKVTCKKPKCSNVEPKKSITPQKKKTYRKKNQISASVKSTETNDSNEQSDPKEFFSSLNLIVNDETNFVPNSLETCETDSLSKDLAKTNIKNNVATDRLKIRKNIALDKCPIKKSSKSISSKKKSSMINHINEDNTSNEHKINDKSKTTKKSKKKTSTTITYGKKKLPINNLNNNNVSDNIENTIHLVVSQTNQSEASKSTKNICEVKNLDLNNDNKSNELQRSNDIVLPKNPKIKMFPKSIANIKKKPVMNKNNAALTLEENILSCQRGSSRKKIVELPETDGNILKNDSCINRSRKLSVILEGKDYCSKTGLSKKSKDDTIMLKNNNKLNKSRKPPEVLENIKCCPKTGLSKNSKDDANMLRNNNKLSKSRKLPEVLKNIQYCPKISLLKKSHGDAIILKNNNKLSKSRKLPEVLENVQYCPMTDLSEKSQDDAIMLKNDNKLSKSKKLPEVLENVQYCPRTDLSEKIEDDSLMVRNDNIPPRIKKKSCDVWTGDRLFSQTMWKSNNKVSSFDSKQNPKRKIVKAKRKKKCNLNIENPDLIGSSITNASEPQILENLLITESIPSTKPIGSGNDIISETVGVKTLNNMPWVADTKSSSKVTVVPTVSTEISKIALTNDDNELSLDKTMSDPSNSLNPMITSELSYGMAILSEAISRQCRESTNGGIKRKLPEPDLNKVQSLKKTNNSSRSQVPSAMISPQIVNNSTSKEVVKYIPEICEQPVETNLQSHVENEIFLLSKRFNISIDSLTKTVVDEPLSVFHKKYSESVLPSMVRISPIVKDVETKSRLNVNYIGGNLDVEYKVEPIREGEAYEKSNLKDLMIELSKTMPSWSLSIVTNPPRYVISHMIIDVYGIPSANKCIVLDKSFRASVYINQCLEHTYCKQYTTATEIVNLIKELNSV